MKASRKLIGFIFVSVFLFLGPSGWAIPSERVAPDPAVLDAFKNLKTHIAVIPDEMFGMGNRVSLMQKLENAGKAYARGQACPAANILKAYLNETQALRQGKGLQAAEDLYNRGRNLRANLLRSLPEGQACKGHERVTQRTRIKIERADNTQLSAGVVFQEPLTQTVNTDQETFTQLTVPGLPIGIGDPGVPDVPILRRLIAVPRGASVAIHAQASVGESIQLNLYPIQPQPNDQGGNGFSPGEFTKNSEIYGADEWLPQNVCAVTIAGRVRDLTVAELACAVGQYNPARQILNLFSAVDFQVSFQGGTGAFLTDASLSPFDHTLAMVDGLVMNREVLDIYVSPGLQPIENNGEELLILTHPNFRPAAERLAQWKRQKGIITNVFNVMDGAGPGPDTREAIDAFIENRYWTSRVRPSYVLLLGDADFIPTFYVLKQGSSFDTIGSDYPYAVVHDPGDPFDYLLPELAVGRISVDTLTQANTVVDKIIQYESSPPTERSFYNRAALVGQFQCCRYGVAEDGTDERTFIESSEFARDILGRKGYSVDRIFTATGSLYYWLTGGSILSSSDGMVWTARSTGTSKYFGGITFGRNIFVAVGNQGTIVTSPNGINWTQRSSGTDDFLNAVAYGNNRFVVVGRRSKNLTSPDGVNWTAYESLKNKSLYDLVYWNGLFIAVGYQGGIVTSPDGVNWTERTSGTTSPLYRLAHTSSRVVAVGEAGAIVSSTDGMSWTSRSSGTSEDLVSVAAREGLFVAVGGNGTIITSPDGSTWTSRTSGTSGHIYAVTVTESGAFLASGWPSKILTSSDGINWAVQSSDSLKFFGWIYRITRGAGTFVGLSNRNATPQRYYDGTPIPTAIGPGSAFPWDGSTEKIIEAFNSGRFLIMHRDHGHIDRWVHPEFTKDHILNNLQNGNLLPVVFSVNCASGIFDNETAGGVYETQPGVDNFAEELLRKSGGGAVGILGTTRVSPSWPNTYLAKGLFDAIWPEALPGFGTNTSKRRLGDMLNHAKLYMLSQIGAYANLFNWESANRDTLNNYALWHVIGDPTLEIWTASPYPLPADNTVRLFPDSLEVAYGVEGATITAFQETSSGIVPVGRAHVKGGQATLYFVVAPDPGQPILLSASMENGVSRILTRPELVLDQANEGDATVSLGCGKPPMGLGSLFQSFIPNYSTLAAVDLRLRAGGSFPAGGFTTATRIRENTPYGTVLAEAKADVSGPLAPGVQVDVRFMLPWPVNVNPGYTYVIEWISPEEGGFVLTWMVSDSDAYAYGKNFGCWGYPDPTSRDMIFRTYAYQ